MTENFVSSQIQPGRIPFAPCEPRHVSGRAPFQPLATLRPRAACRATQHFTPCSFCGPWSLRPVVHALTAKRCGTNAFISTTNCRATSTGWPPDVPSRCRLTATHNCVMTQSRNAPAAHSWHEQVACRRIRRHSCRPKSTTNAQKSNLRYSA